LDHDEGPGTDQALMQPYEPGQRTSISRKTAYPELTGEVAMVGAPLDTTRADRGGAAAPVDRGGVLRRFLGSGSGRKVRYARLLVEALAPAQVPRPLDRLLAYVTSG